MTQIAVIVPMYNVEKYVAACLQSVQNQTFGDFECLCIDDGSPDNSGKIAAEFAAKDKRFRVLHQKNAGLSAARNAGVKNTTAPYVFFLDSDDYIHPQTLEFLFKTIQKYQTPVVSCDLQKTEDVFHPIEPNLSYEETPIEVIENPLEAFCHKKIPTSVWTRLYERTFVEKIPFVEGIYFEDVPFTAECLSKIKTLPKINAPLNYYFCQSGSIMRSPFSVKKVDSYDILIRHLHTYFSHSAPQKMPMIQACIFNQRIKMMLNQCIRKQPNKTAQVQLFGYAQDKVKSLYEDGIISLNGLKLKHKLAIWVLLNHSAQTACRLYRIITKLP